MGLFAIDVVSISALSRQTSLKQAEPFNGLAYRRPHKKVLDSKNDHLKGKMFLML